MLLTSFTFVFCFWYDRWSVYPQNLLTLTSILFFLFFLCLLGYCKFRFRKSSHLIRPDSTQMFDYAEKFSCWLVTMHNIVSMLLKWTCDAYFKLCIVVLTALSCCSSNRVTLYDSNFKVIPLYIKLGLVEPYLCLLQKHPFFKKRRRSQPPFDWLLFVNRRFWTAGGWGFWAWSSLWAHPVYHLEWKVEKLS